MSKCVLSRSKNEEKTIVEKYSSWSFFSVHLDYCFETLAFFLSKSKNNSFKYQLFHIEIVHFFQHLFLEELIWTVETPFRQPCQQIYGKNPKYPLEDIKRSTIFSCFIKNSLKCSSGPVGYSCEKYASMFRK